MKETRVLGIYVSDRIEAATEVQSVLTKFGCSIKTRLGLHDVTDEVCSTGGLILLELTNDREEAVKLENNLLKIEGIQVEKMTFKS